MVEKTKLEKQKRKMTKEISNKIENETGIHFFIAEAETKSKIENMIKSASTHEDLNEIGAKINYAINNKYHSINIAELQYQASRKMREIYNKIGEYVSTD